MTWTTDLTEGVAALLAANGVGTWRTSGVYATGETGIVVRTVPQSPNRVVTLAPYDVEADPNLTDAIQGMQVIVRSGGADPRDADTLNDSVYDVLHGLRRTVVNGVHVVLAWRQSGASLGQDGNQRWSLSSNYYLRVRRGTPHLED